MNQQGVSHDEVQKFLSRRIWLFFLRARSWGVSVEELRKHASSLVNSFPSERRTILVAVQIVKVLHPKMASTLRRIRRNIVGM